MYQSGCQGAFPLEKVNFNLVGQHKFNIHRGLRYSCHHNHIMGQKKLFCIILIDKVLKVGTFIGVAEISSYLLKLLIF